MARRLFNIASAVSLVLFVAVCVLWVRSYWVSDVVSRRDTNLDDGTEPFFDPGPFYYTDEVELTAARGGVRVERRRVELRGGYSGAWLPPGWSHEVYEFVGTYPTIRPRELPRNTWRDWGGGGFQVTAADDPPNGRGTVAWHRSVTAPLWLPALLTAALPGLRLASRRRRRSHARRRAGLNPSRGYDLRATPDRCPECGEAVVVRS